MITVTSLSVAYGAVQALRDVSFQAGAGQITAVLGANGAGKTTLLRTISGLVTPTQGRVDFGSTALVGRRAEEIARLGVGHVPEGRGVISEFTVEENLRLGSMFNKTPLAKGLAEQYELFPALGERRKQHAAKLSGGERQMLAMARALIAEPTVLLLDEPSLGLAPLVTAQLMKTIKDLCEKKKLTVILVEQNAVTALRISSHAVVLNLGRVVADDDASVIGEDENLRQYYLGMSS